MTSRHNFGSPFHTNIPGRRSNPIGYERRGFLIDESSETDGDESDSFRPIMSTPIPRSTGVTTTSRCQNVSNGSTPDRSAIGGGGGGVLADEEAIALSVWNGMNWSHVESSSDEEDRSDDRPRRYRSNQRGGLRRAQSDPSLDSSISEDDLAAAAAVPLWFRLPIPADFLGQEARRRSRSNTYNDAEEYEFWRGDPGIELHDFLDPQDHDLEDELALQLRDDESRNHSGRRNCYGPQNKLMGCRWTPLRLLASVFVVCMYTTFIVPDPPEWHVAEAAAAAAQQQESLRGAAAATLPKFARQPGFAAPPQQQQIVVGQQRGPSFALARSAADVTQQMHYVRPDLDPRYYQQPAFLQMSAAAGAAATTSATDASWEDLPYHRRVQWWIQKLITAWYMNAAIVLAVAVWAVREQRRRGQAVCEM